MEPWEMHAWFADYLEACNRHDFAALRSLIDPSVRRAHRPAGVDAWLFEWEELFDAFPDWRWKRIQLVVEDDRIAAHLRASGTHVGVYRGLAPTRRHVNVAEFAFVRVVGGRIVESTGSGDEAILRQLEG